MGKTAVRSAIVLCAVAVGVLLGGVAVRHFGAAGGAAAASVGDPAEETGARDVAVATRVIVSALESLGPGATEAEAVDAVQGALAASSSPAAAVRSGITVALELSHDETRSDALRRVYAAYEASGAEAALGSAPDAPGESETGTEAAGAELPSGVVETRASHIALPPLPTGSSGSDYRP